VDARTPHQGPLQIATARLILRALTLQDAEHVLRHFSDPEMLRYMTFEPLEQREEAEEVIQWGVDLFARGAGALWGIVDKETGALIGTLNYVKKEGHRAEITYDLATIYWGRGLMTEAIRSTLPYVFGDMGVQRIETIVHVQNVRSARVLLKLGFRMEGVLRQYTRFHGQLSDVHMFSLLKADWQAAQGGSGSGTPT
jgi:ribosomal-protein-alanine N-acetyltransferase